MRLRKDPLRVVVLGALLAAGLTLAACAERPPEAVRLTLLATTDFHGALESPGPDAPGGRPLGGAAALAATIERTRRENPEGTLLLDAGDVLHGTALSNASRGAAVVELMNLIGFDAAAIGNHEFDWGVEVLEERIAQADFPFLAANVIEKETGRPPSWAVGYRVFERRGVRVAVIGLATPRTPATTLPSNVESLAFLAPAPVVRRLVDELIPSRADLAVVLCHIGVRLDDGTDLPGGPLAELARASPGVAAIVGGHSHRRFAGEIGGIPVVQAGDRGEVLGRIELYVDPRERRILSTTAELVEVFADAVEPDPRVTALVESSRERADRRLRRVIGEAADAIERRRGDSPLGNLVTDAIRQRTGADVVLQNPGGLRADVASGPIRYEDVYDVVPFENTIVFVELTAVEIEAVLEQAVDAIGFLHVSGLRYRVDPDRPAGSRVTISPPLDPGRIYKTAVNNFLAQGGDGLKLLADRPEALDTGILLRDELVGWIEEQTRAGKKITARVDGRLLVEAGRLVPTPAAD